MKNILIVDDDIPIGDLMEKALAKEGYGVFRAYSGTEALLMLSGSGPRPDLVLLDLMLPGQTGEEVLPRIEGIPVIVVSAKAGIDDKVELLLGGAVDYMTKPFSVKELLARVQVHLRAGTGRDLSAVYTAGDLRLDAASHQVFAAEKAVKLTRTEYAILKLFLQNPKRVIAKSVILDQISADTPDCTESSLKIHISNLRKKLREAAGKEYIEAVWGIGFKLSEED